MSTSSKAKHSENAPFCAKTSENKDLKTLTKKCIPCILLLYISLCVFRCSNVEDNRKCIEMYAFADKNTLLCAVEKKTKHYRDKKYFPSFCWRQRQTLLKTLGVVGAEWARYFFVFHIYSISAKWKLSQCYK